MTDFDVVTLNEDISIQKHDLTSTLGRMLGTTSEWITMGDGTDSGYYFFYPNTEYVGVFSVSRTGADSMDIFSSIRSDGVPGGQQASFTASDSSSIANHFGLLAFYAVGNAFGSINTPGEADNGIDFTNIKVEVIPEPSSAAPLLAGMLVLGQLIRRRLKG